MKFENLWIKPSKLKHSLYTHLRYNDLNRIDDAVSINLEGNIITLSQFQSTVSENGPWKFCTFTQEVGGFSSADYYAVSEEGVDQNNINYLAGNAVDHLEVFPEYRKLCADLGSICKKHLNLLCNTNEESLEMLPSVETHLIKFAWYMFRTKQVERIEVAAVRLHRRGNAVKAKELLDTLTVDECRKVNLLNVFTGKGDFKSTGVKRLLLELIPSHSREKYKSITDIQEGVLYWMTDNEKLALYEHNQFIKVGHIGGVCLPSNTHHENYFTCTTRKVLSGLLKAIIQFLEDINFSEKRFMPYMNENGYKKLMTDSCEVARGGLIKSYREELEAKATADSTCIFDYLALKHKVE